MKAIRIDATSRTISEVDYSGDYRQILVLIDAELFDCARFNRKGDAVFVSDIGMLDGTDHFFRIAGYRHPLAGNGLILGCDGEGNSTNPSVSLAWVTENTAFLTRGQVLDMFSGQDDGHEIE